MRPKLSKAERRTETIFALLKPKEMRQLDKVAKQADQSRSATIRAAINEYLARRSQKVIATNA